MSKVSGAVWGVGWEKEGGLATRSLGIENLHQKSRCEMMIGRNDISNIITLGTCFSIFCLHSCSFLLHAYWQKSDSSVDGEPLGNWRTRNSNPRDVIIASSPSFSSPVAGVPREFARKLEIW